MWTTFGTRKVSGLQGVCSLGLQYTVSGHYLEAYVSRFQVRDMQSYVQTQVHQVLYTRWISGMSGFRGKFTLQ